MIDIRRFFRKISCWWSEFVFFHANITSTIATMSNVRWTRRWWWRWWNL